MGESTNHVVLTLVDCFRCINQSSLDKTTERLIDLFDWQCVCCAITSARRCPSDRPAASHRAMTLSTGKSRLKYRSGTGSSLITLQFARERSGQPMLERRAGSRTVMRSRAANRPEPGHRSLPCYY